MKEILLWTEADSTCVTHLGNLWFDLSFHGKACYVQLDSKCFRLFSLNTSKFWKTSEHCILAAGDHDAAQTAKILETAVVSEEIGNEFDQVLAVRRLSNTTLPPAVRSTIHQG